MKAFSLAILALLSFALLFSYGCAQQRNEAVVQEPPAVEPPASQTGAELCGEGNIVQKDECFASLARSESDPEICRRIYSIEKLDACYASFAGMGQSICTKITDAGMKADCLLQNALRAKDEDICGLIENVGKRASCLEQVVPPCMLVADIEKRELCFALEKSDYTLCKADSCFEEYAKNKSDANACQLISAPVEKYSCIAIVGRSVALCGNDGFLKSASKDSCVEKASKELGDVAGCGFATPGSEYSNRCYLHFAIEGGDMDICRKCHTEENRDSCYMGYALQAANVSSCPKVINSLNRIDCYFKAARGNRMPSLCNPIATFQERSSCQAAAINLDAGPLPSDCQFVNIVDWRNKCYYRVARSTYNSTLCGLMTPGPDKDSCNSLFGITG